MAKSYLLVNHNKQKEIDEKIREVKDQDLRPKLLKTTQDQRDQIVKFCLQIPTLTDSGIRQKVRNKLPGRAKVEVTLDPATSTYMSIDDFVEVCHNYGVLLEFIQAVRHYDGESIYIKSYKIGLMNQERGISQKIE
ncbi:hypothetical protein [Candidatus Chlorohelix sp.]|uniref:hypothetical protein n=1 Tax=Candidatus Chlorohelix sp. TaxID=3139201 RepID=UPI00303C840F